MTAGLAPLSELLPLRHSGHQLHGLPCMGGGEASHEGAQLRPRRAGRRRRPTTSRRRSRWINVHAAGRPGGSPGRRALAVILAIIGFLAIIAGILYLAGAANSLHFMVGSVHKGHHLIRAGVSLVAGVVLLAGAWFAARAGENSRR